MSSRLSIQHFISPTEPQGVQVGDEWYNPTTSILQKRTLVSGSIGWSNILTNISPVYNGKYYPQMNSGISGNNQSYINPAYVFDVANSRMGIANTTPTVTLTVGGSVRAANLENQAVESVPGTFSTAYNIGSLVRNENPLSSISATYVGTFNQPYIYTTSGTAYGAGTYNVPRVYSSSSVFITGTYNYIDRGGNNPLDTAKSGTITGTYNSIRHVFDPNANTSIVTGSIYNTKNEQTIEIGSVTSSIGNFNGIVVGLNSFASANVTNYYGNYGFGAVVGSSSPFVSTSTITNYYGAYYDIPTVNTSGRITNRYAIYSADVASNTFFQGPIYSANTITASAFVGNGAGLTGINAGATITDDTTSNATRYIMLGQSSSGSYTVANTSSTKLTYNPSTGALSSKLLTLTPGTSGVTTGLYINGGDITAARSGTTGVIYFGTNASTYLYFDGTNYNFGGTNTVIATTFSGSGASLTSLTAGNLSGTIPSAVLGNSTLYVGTTAIALNRASASQTLTGISIDGNAATATNASNVNTTGGAVLGYTPASTGVGVAGGLGPYVGFGQASTYAAGFSLHRSGAYAINVGLDTDNYFRIGGWSDGLNTYRMTLDTAGAAVFRGNVTAYSDIRLKENIKVIPNALDKVKGIRGVTFTRNDIDDKEKIHTGVIAQEVLEVFPEAVTSNNDGPYYSIAYGNMVGLLIEAIKEQQLQIEQLSKKVNKLEGR